MQDFKIVYGSMNNNVPLSSVRIYPQSEKALQQWGSRESMVLRKQYVKQYCEKKKAQGWTYYHQYD